MARKSRKNVDVEPLRTAIYVRTALYVRLSVEDGNGRSNSIENQQLMLNDYIADKPEFQLVDTYIDNGLSGMTFDRPDFQRMLADIERGAVNCVIVKDISRLGRNSIDTGYYIEQYFVQHKVRFISVTDNYDSAEANSARDGLLLSLKAMINEAYALDISKKEKSAMRQLMLSGKLANGQAPYGYVKDPNDRQRLVIDEEAAAVVRQIFEWFLSGISVYKITKMLDEAGIKTRSQRKNLSNKGSGFWDTRSVTGILKNENYTGDLVQGKYKKVDRKLRLTEESEHIIVRNTHEAIISREDFEKAKQMLADNAEAAKRKERIPLPPSIFTCNMVCPHCGKRLYRQRDINSQGKAFYYYACVSKYKFSSEVCVGVRINEEIIKEAALEGINAEIAALGKTFTRGFTDKENKTADALNKQNAEKQREINRVQSLIRGLYESVIGGLITNDEYLSFKNSYIEQVDALKSEIEQIRIDLENIDERRKQYAEAQESSKVFKKSKELTSELIERVVEQIEVNHDGDIAITFKSGREFRKENV